LYDPCDFNDRLVLGLKGTMSEAELHVLRSRLRGGLLAKARRGELNVSVPAGFVHDPAGRIVLDPDAGVASAVRHLFATFARTGSARAVVKCFAAEGLLFPTRIRSGPCKGELVWVPLRHARVVGVLHNPHYAGAYFFGRTRTRPGPGARVTTSSLPREQWASFIPDAHPGYIDWETFEANQAHLLANAQAHGADRRAGPAREGGALLQGLAVCARCGKRMTVSYHLRRSVERPDYNCMSEAIATGSPRCQSVPGSVVDRAVAEVVLETLTPLALEAALSLAAELQARVAEADALRRTHVDRARQHADLARRRYLGVDPANRLVADSLEADWNNALRALNDAQDDYDRASAAANAALSEDQAARVRSLASDFPALWSDPATPQRERKRMIRLLIDDVTLHKTDVIHVHIRFRGGQTRSLSLPIPPRAAHLYKTNPDTLALVDRLLDDHTDSEVADALNQAGHRSGRGGAFDTHKIIELRRCNGLASHRERLASKGLLTRAEAAAALGVHPNTITKWYARGLLVAYRANEHNDLLYELPAALARRAASQALRRSRTGPNRPHPQEVQREALSGSRS
jgi:hypothetical protein